MEFVVREGVTPPAGQEPTPGQVQRLALEFDDEGAITSLAVTDEDGWPEGLVIEHLTPVSGEGRFVAGLVLAGRATGLPEMQLTLPGAPISGGDVALWTLEDGDSRSWSAVDDLFAAEPTDEQFALDARSGRVVFGDGEHGRVPPIGARILCRYS